jgi:hypothetical protein
MEEQFAFIGSHCGESVTIETPKIQLAHFRLRRRSSRQQSMKYSTLAANGIQINAFGYQLSGGADCPLELGNG